MRLRLADWRERLRGTLWAIPAVFVISAVISAVALSRLDEQLAGARLNLGLAGDAAAARTLLATIATAMITFTGLVFSVLILVLQSASAQFSPRVLRNFLRDRNSQVALGLFSATFTYALVLIPAVEAPLREDPGQIPIISVTVAVALMLASIGFFVYFINHVAQSIRAATIIRGIAEETAGAVERLYPEPFGSGHDAQPVAVPLEPETAVATATRSGFVQAVDGDGLLRHASAHNALVEVIPMVGDYVLEGSTLIRAWSLEEDRESLNGAVLLGTERTMQQDPAFGFRQLVDIALKALSPAVNDPTTAIEALDRITWLLQLLGGRDFPSTARRDAEDVVRLLLPRPSWEDYVHLGFDEIRHFGASSPAVARALVAALNTLLAATPSWRHEPLELQLGLVRRAVQRSIPDQEEVDWILRPSR